MTAQNIHAVARFNMVESQIRTNRVSDSALLRVLGDIPREIFVPEALASVAYVDKSLHIGSERYLLEPLVLGRLLQEAMISATDRVLVVGAGTGYSVAVLARLTASVTGVESDAGLGAKARANLVGLGIANAAIQVGPMTGGWAAAAPFDLILIDGMVAELPEPILAQLAERGRLVTVRSQEGRSGAGVLYRKLGGTVSGRKLFDAVTPFLPGFAPRPAFAL